MVRQLIFLFYTRTSVLLIAYYVFFEKQKLPSYLLLHLLLHRDSTFLYILQFCPKVFNYTDIEVQCWENYCEFKLTVFQFTGQASAAYPLIP